MFRSCAWCLACCQYHTTLACVASQQAELCCEAHATPRGARHCQASSCHLLSSGCTCRLERPAADVVAALAASDGAATLAALFSADQLRAAIANDPTHALAPFRENCVDGVHPSAPPPFLPTYKYVAGSSEYDGKRAPSWTDRVLWRCNYAHAAPAAAVSQTRYDAVGGVRQSDHRPVVAALHVALKHSAPLMADDAVDVMAAYVDGSRGRTHRKWLSGVGGGRSGRLRMGSIAPLDTAPLQRNADVL
jgi:hypothetical protein